MRRATAAGMRNAFGGECAAHVRYLIFSERAALERFPNVARMFRAFAAAARVRASGHYRQTRELLGEYCVNFTAPFIYNRTVDNLVKACEAEREESEEAYPAFAAVAQAQGEARAARDFGWIARAKESNAAMAKRALGHMERAGEEPELGDLCVCGVCGLVVEGAPPETCPVCMAERPGFKSVE